MAAAPVPNTKKVTNIYGVATIPSTVSGNATVAFNVRAFVLFNVPLFYFGTANYADPGAGKQANGIVLTGSVPRHGIEGARLTAFGFGPQFKSGSVTFDVDDLSSRGLGPDTVSVSAGGALAYVNPGGTVTSGDITVLPH